MRTKLFFGAAAAALLLWTPASAQDAPGDASTQQRFTGEAIEAELSPAGDVDWYRMSVEQGRRYSITLQGIPDADGNAVDPMLGVYDLSGNQLAFNDDDGVSLNSALQYAPSQSGEVFIEARAFSEEGVGPYRLAATSAETPPDDAGNDASTSARLSPGRAINGEIEYEGDTDWYRLSVRTGQLYRITMTGAEGAQTPLGDPLLQVFDSDGNVIATNDDSDGTLNSSLELRPQRNGDVFVEARAYADAYSGTYTLNVTAERAPTDNISADTRTRGRIDVGGAVDGALDFNGDVDWYRIRLQEGQSYRFTLNGSGGSALGDPLLRLHDARGDEVAMDDDGGAGFNSYLEYTAPSSGNYYLAASPFAEGTTGGYTLTAYAGDIPADASTDAALSADGDYREGMLSPAGDRDWYRVDLTEGQGLRVALVNAQTPDGLGDPYLIFYGPDGAEIARDDDGGEGLNSFLELTAAATGPHYIEARGFTEDATGRYAISITPGEIGDGPEGAEYIMPGMEGRMATLGTAGDVDWFSIELIEGRPYRFNLTGVDGGLGDPMLTLYDAEGVQVAQDDDGGVGLNSYLTFASPTGGSYFAAVSAYDGVSTGQYMLSVTDTDVPGHIYTDEYLDAASDERLSRIDMEGDLDYYRVELEGGVRYVIAVNGAGDHPLADPYLVVTDGENNNVGSDDDSGAGLNARLRFRPETSGVYYIQASGLGGSTGWYQVSIVRQ